jgi:hypothetical protein
LDGAATVTQESRPARLIRLESLSDQRLAVFTLDGTEHEIVAALPPETVLTPGADVRLRFRRQLWFDAQGQRVGT